MDAVEFLKGAQRYYESDIKAIDKLKGFYIDRNFVDFDFEQMVEIVQKWTEEHPIKTRQSEFLKLYPNVIKDYRDIINISPCVVDTTCKNSNCYDDCARCRHEYWLQEVE